MNIERYQELVAIQKETLLSFKEQEELIAISTEFLYTMMASDKEANDILVRLRNR
jgi:hypothetical protein